MQVITREMELEEEKYLYVAHEKKKCIYNV